MCNTQILKYQIQNKKKHYMVELVTTAISLFHLYIHNMTEKQIRTAAFQVKAHQRKKGKLTVAMKILGSYRQKHSQTGPAVRNSLWH